MENSAAMKKLLGGFTVRQGLPPLLYYIMPLENFRAVRKHGFVCRNEALRLHLPVHDYSDQDVQLRRSDRLESVYQRCLHEYVPLYLNPRNPMLYCLRDKAADIVVLGIDPAVLDYREDHFVFADGNAASLETRFSRDPAIFRDSLTALQADYWNNVADGKRRRCAEVLVLARIPPGFIEWAICSSQAAAAAANNAGLRLDDRLIVDTSFFYLNP